LRDGLASRALEGLVRARSYADPRRMTTRRPAAAILAAPGPMAEQNDQLLFGEAFDVLAEHAGFSWGQAVRDGYVGFVETDALSPARGEATRRVAALSTYAFARPDMKARAAGPFSLNALLTVEAREGRFVKAEGSGWFVEEHLAPIGIFESDPVAVAERHLGAPYLWGGRESLGLDCSGLVQQALFACGRACPRDSDQQEVLGAPVDPAGVRRGDLVFWPGHVAFVLDGGRLLHASAHQMAVVIEPMAEVVERIAAAGGGQPISCRRL
jgi:cell wall-associated NlpC family hydrolase